jgi:hypothetical protein
MMSKMPSVVTGPPAAPALGMTTYTIVPDVIVVYGCCWDGGSVGGGSVTGGSVVIHGTVVVSHVVMSIHVDSRLHHVTDVSHGYTVSQVVSGQHTVVMDTQGWH